MPGTGGVLDEFRQGSWLTRQRVVVYGGLLLGFELLLFLFLIAGTHGLIVPLDTPTTTDFVSFYAAGQLADAGTPALAYDQAAHYAAEQLATAPGIGYQFFYYPPVFQMLCALLARLPYLVAFVVFEAATLILYLLVARGILRDKRWTTLLPLLAFPSIFWTLGLGQNALLTAALFGAATLLVDRRPGTAGLLFGALCYKPHFGLLIPVALAAGRHWRAFAAAALSTGTLILLSLLLFGWQSWRGFLTALAGSQGTYDSGRIDLAGFVSPFGALRLIGFSTTLSLDIQWGVTLLAAAFIAGVWGGRLSLPIRAAALASATLVAVPVALTYDLMLASIAVLWLVRAGRERGFLPWEQTGLVGLFLVPLFSRSVGHGLHVPLAALAAFALFLMVAAVAWREWRDPARAGSPRARAARADPPNSASPAGHS